MTKEVFINKITKLREGSRKILAKQISISFAKPDRGFIHIFTSERGCITPKIRTLPENNTIFIYKQVKKFLFTLESGAIARHHITHS